MIFDQPSSESELDPQRRAAEAEAIAAARAHAEELRRTKTPLEQPEPAGNLFASEREKTPEPIAPPSVKSSVAESFFNLFRRK